MKLESIVKTNKGCLEIHYTKEVDGKIIHWRGAYNPTETVNKITPFGESINLPVELIRAITEHWTNQVKASFR